MCVNDRREHPGSAERWPETWLRAETRLPPTLEGIILPKKMERFTVRARRAMLLAQTEAEKRQHTLIDTEHLLLGMVPYPGHIGHIGTYVLNLLDFQQIETVLKELSPANESVRSEALELSPRVRELLQLSVREAQRMGHDYIDTEHLLLGMLRQTDPKTLQIIKNPDELRGTIQNILWIKHTQLVGVFDSLMNTRRFGHSASSILSWTQIEAQNLNCKLLDTQHLLLGLLHGGNFIVQQVFAENGITYTGIMHYWLQTPAEPHPERPKLSPAFRQVFKQAIIEADAFEQWRVGPEHVLLSLITLAEGEVSNLLECVNANPQKIREHTLQLIQEVSYDKPIPREHFTSIHHYFRLHK